MTTTQELIDECTKWIDEANTPDIKEFVTALRDKLIAAQEMANALEKAQSFLGYMLDHTPEDKADNSVWFSCKEALSKWRDTL